MLTWIQHLLSIPNWYTGMIKNHLYTFQNISLTSTYLNIVHCFWQKNMHFHIRKYIHKKCTLPCKTLLTKNVYTSTQNVLTQNKIYTFTDPKYPRLLIKIIMQIITYADAIILYADATDLMLGLLLNIYHIYCNISWYRLNTYVFNNITIKKITTSWQFMYHYISQWINKYSNNS